LRMLLSFCDVRADRKFARGSWNRHPLMYGTGGCKGTRPSGGIDERQENRDCCHGWRSDFFAGAAHCPKVDGFRGWRNPRRDVPLLCRVLRSNRCNSKNLRTALKSLPCGLVTGKSLILPAIVVENLFRSSYSAVIRSEHLCLGATTTLFRRSDGSPLENRSSGEGRKPETVTSWLCCYCGHASKAAPNSNAYENKQLIFLSLPSITENAVGAANFVPFLHWFENHFQF
jgi:hypothetical protein